MIWLCGHFKNGLKATCTGCSVAVLFAGLIAGHAFAQEKGAGIQAPVQLAPFNPAAPRCQSPPNLARGLAFAQDNERQFMQGVNRGLQLAAADRGLTYRNLVADNDAALMSRQIQTLAQEQMGAVVVAPINPRALAPDVQNLIWQGSYVGAVVPPPATTILNAPQYLTGRVLAEAAVEYIKQHLRGKAKVVLLTHDSLEFLSPRFKAMRDALNDLPGVTIVADISPATVNKAGGFATMQTILLAYPTIDVVLGADTVVLGALDALRAAGKDRADQFLGGIDGEEEAVSEIKKGGPYKISVSLASSVFGYALGQYGADWLDGKSVPQAMDILPRALTLQTLNQYEKDVADPKSVYDDPVRRDSYLKMYGNICYDTRDQYLNFPWSSEK